MHKHASMNRVYRLVWNEALDAWIAVSEITRGRRKRNGRRAAILVSLLGLNSLGAYATPPAPTELPTGGKVVAGAATISPASTPDAAVLNIDQASQRAAIDWNTFNVGTAAQVSFNQPNQNSATLNRVLDTNPSQIFGKITATGQVFLTNPNGVYFGKTASVDVGGLVATTHDVDNADFMAENITLNRNGATGSVVNDGEMHAALGGYIALLAPEVRNGGIIVAKLGTVALAAGESITLNFDGTHLAAITVQPSSIASLVENKSAVLAPGGLIVLSAKAVDSLQGGVVRNSGTLEATGLSNQGGHIVLEATSAVENTGTINANTGIDGSPAGAIAIDAPEITNSGTVTAAATSSVAQQIASTGPTAGGAITLTGRAIEQTDAGTLDVSGVTGGSVKIQATDDVTIAGTVSAAGVDFANSNEATDPSAHGGTVAIKAEHSITLQSAQIDVSGDAHAGDIVFQGGGIPVPGDPLRELPTLALLGGTQVRASSRRGQGGSATLTGHRVGLFDASSIDASGATGGGKVFVGGGFHGEDPSIANAQQVVIADGVRIDTSATQSGDGGNVVVWSDGFTAFAGDIVARGGADQGAGGFVEVSGKGSLQFVGSVDAGASHGTAGTLLLDPTNITVDSSGPATLSSDTLAFATNASTDSFIAASTITGVTDGGSSVTLQANNDLIINSAIATLGGGAGGALIFQAGRSITVNAAVLSDNGAINFTTNDSAANGTYRQAGTAAFTNNSVIDAGSGNVSITMGTFAGTSGAVNTGHIAATNLTVTHNGPTVGAASGVIDLGQSDLTGTLSITANSARNVTNTLGTAGAAGTVVVRGNATISVGTGNVTINGSFTDFNVISLTAGSATLADTNAMQFGTTSLSGSLVQTTVGPIASTGSVQVAGTTTLTTNTGGFGYADPYINLTNAANNFGGNVTLSVPSSGQTGTGGYATIRDSGAITIASSGTSSYLQVQAGGATTVTAATAGTSIVVTTSSGAVNLGTTIAGSSVTVTGTSTANLTSTTAGSFLTINAAGAVDLGTTTLGTELTVSTAGAITDSGVLTVPNQTALTAGSANDITLDSANNNFNGIRIISGKNVTLVDQNAINFGQYQGAGGWTSHIYGNLSVTASGNISQQYNDNDGYSQITVDGNSTFTANHASAQINLYLGSSDPFNAGESNNFAGTITLARNNGNTGFSNVQLRNTSSSAAVLTGLTSVGSLTNVYLRFDNAPSVTLPGMALSGSLKVYAPSVSNTAGTPSNIISQSGAITVAGSTIMAAGSTGDIVLTNAANDFNIFGIANVGARDLTLVDASAVVFYAAGYHQYVSRHWNVTANGDISDLGNNVTVPGTATFNAGTHNISLVNANWILNILAIPAANNATVYPWTSVVLDNVTVAGALNITSRNFGYGLTQVASTAVTAPTGSTTTLNNFSSGITLNQTGNVMGNLAISNAGAITIRENDAITQQSAWTTYNSSGSNSTRYAVALTTSNDQAITLDQANYFGNLTITQVNFGAGAAGAVLVRETGDSFDGLTEGSAWTVHGTTKIDTGSYSVNLNNGNNVFGPLQVTAGTGLTNSLASTVTIYAKSNGVVDAITDVGGTGAWTAGTGAGASLRLVAYNGAGAIAGGGNVNLTNPANVLGDLYVKSAAATITENDSITDGASTVWFGSDTGWLTTGATNFVVANPTGKSITLDNLTNQLGPVSLSTAGTAGTLSAVLITDNTDLTQSSVWTVGTAPVTLDARNHAINLSSTGNVLGNITINTTNGTPTSVAITEDDPITQGSAWIMSGVPVTLVAQNDNAITLTNALNVMGALTVTGGTVGITENDPITQSGAWTTTGTTTLNATTNAITLTNASNVMGALAISGTPSGVSITENDDITQASAWVQATTPFTLNAGTDDITLSQASNQLGDLTLTAQNATIVENSVAGITDLNAWTLPGTTTLTAGSANPIILNASPTSNFGTVSIVSASNADIADVDGIIFGASTIASGGILTVTAGGAITQSGAITAPSLRLIGTGYATLTNSSNNVQNLAAGFSGGDLAFTNAGNFAVAVVGGTSGVTISANDVTLTSATGTITGLATVNASSSSLNVTTGTALSLPQMSIAGPQTYTASTVSGSGIALTASVTSTASGVITFNSPVTLGADLSVQTTNSDINFNSTVSGATNQLIVNAGSGLVTFGGAVSAIGATGDAGAALQLTSTGATFNSTLGANNGLAITGPVVFKDSVTLADGNAASVFTGLVTLGKVGGMNLSGYDGMTFNGGVLLQNGPTTINSNNSALSFQTAGSVSGPYGLTLNSGTQSISGLDRMGTDLTSLTVTGLSVAIPTGGVSIAGPQSYTATAGSSITLNGNVTSTATGTIAFNSPTIVGANSTVTTTNSNVTFASTLDGNKNLTVSTGSGTKTFTGTVGAVTPLGSGTGAALILQGSGATAFSDTVRARSGITVAGPVTFNKDVTLTSGGTGSTFSGLVTTGGASGNTLSGFDGMAFGGGLALIGGPVSVISNGGTISFGAAVSGPQNLTVNALLGGAGIITGLDQIGFASNLTRLTLIAQTLNLPSTGLAVAGPMDFTAAGGITLNGAVGNSSGPATTQITFNSAANLATGAIAITNNNAAVTFASTVNGARALTISNGSGTTTFGGLVGGTTPLSSLTTDVTGATAINGGGISTSGAQSFNDAVTLGAATTLSGVDVHFASTLNGASTLAINDSGTTIFAGIVGGSTPLTSLTTNAAGSTQIDTTAVTTSGAQIYNDSVVLGSNTTLTGAPLTFNGTVNGAFTLNAVAGTGALAFNGIVGGSTPLTSVTASGNTVAVGTMTTTGAQTFTANGGITLNGNLSNTNSNVTITGATTLGGNVVISTGAGPGNITFSGATSTINGARNLTLSAGAGDIVLGGVVGGITPLTAFSASGYNLTLPAINTAGDANQIYSALNNITLNQSRTLNAPITFTADSDNDGSGSFILLNGISLIASNNSLTITAADLDLQGSSTLSSGIGLTTLIASGARNLALGGVDAPGQMTISGSELSRMTTSGGLDLKTTGIGWVHVNGITAGQSQNITGVLALKAQGTGEISFITAQSTFNALTSNATGGIINVAVDLNSTNDPIVFATPVAIAGASTVNSGGGNITFQNTVDVNNDLTLTTSNGVLTFNAAVGSNKTLTLNLGGGSVSGLGNLQNTLTGLTVNSSSGITLPAFTINGPQTYNTGVITATGNLGGIGLTFNNLVNVVPSSGSALVFDAGTGTLAFNDFVALNANNVTLTGDEINFIKAVTGSGNLVLQPFTVGRNVAIGGSGAPIAGLNLTATDISWLPIGTLSSLTFGRSNGTGTLDVAGPINAPNTPVTLNGGGGMTQSGGAITAGALTLRSDAGIALANLSNSLGAITITGTPTSVSIADSTSITQGAAWLLGSAPVTLNAGGGSQNITLTQASNTFGTLVLTGAAVQVTENASTDLGATTASSLTVRSNGNITSSGALAVSGLADFKTLNDGGATTSIANGSTLGSVSAVSRNTADSANASGDISLSLAGSTLLKTLATTDDITLTAANGMTFSQDGTSSLAAAGLELLGAGGTFTLTNTGNAITTLAGNTGTVRFVENSGFGIGTVNTVGLSTSGNLTLSSTGAVTQSQALAAAGLELLGTGGAFTLTDTGNAINTLAGNTGAVSVVENSGFGIGTVNTVGLSTSGNITLSSTGTVTQLQALAASGLELLGTGGTYQLATTGNAITTLAGTTGAISFLDNSGFGIGTVNTVGLSTSGNLTLVSTGAVTQSQNISAAGLELAGTGGSFVLSRSTNSIPVLATNIGSANLGTSGALEVGTVGTAGVTTTGNLTLTTGGAVTQSQALIVAGNLTLQTTHVAGDVGITNIVPSVTVVSDSFVGGDYTLTATGKSVSQFAGSSIQVAGNLTIDAASLSLGGAGNVVQGTTTTPTVAELRQSGVITLGNINQAGNYSVTSIASNKAFNGAAIHGTAVALNNSANNIGGRISVTTVGPSITSGADVQTGIQQAPSTAITVAGVASFTAENSSVPGSSFITLNNSGNSFGSVVLSSKDISITEDTGATVINSATASGGLKIVSAGPVTQTGSIVSPQLAVTTTGAITLGNTANNVTTLALHSGGNAITYVDANQFDVATVLGVSGINSGGSPVTLTAGGSGNITQTDALTNVSTLTATAGGSINLDVGGVSNTIGIINGLSAATGIDVADSAGGLLIDGNVQSAAGNITLLSSGGALTLANARTITAAGSGNIYLAAGPGYEFINNDSTPLTSALQLGSGRFIIYSKSNLGIVKGGLAGNEYMNETYVLNGPATQGGRAGNLFIYNDAATLLFTADNQSRAYGSANAPYLYTVSGYLAGDDASSSFSGLASFSTIATSTSNVGNYAITISNGTLSSSKGYAFLFADGTLTVNPYVVNLTGARAYDGTANVAANALTLGSLVGSETLTLSGVGTIADKHIGTGRSVAINTLSLGNGTGLASNYTLVGGTRAANITAAPLTLSTSNVTRAYDGTLGAVGAAVAVAGTQVFSGDSVSGGAFAFTNANAGSGNKTVTAGGVTVNDGNAGNDYTVSYANNTTSTITPANVTLSTSNVTRTYNGTLAAAGAAVVTAGTLYQNVSNGNVLDNLSGGTFAFADANAGSGNKIVTASGVTLNDGNTGGNYNVTYANNTTSTINRANITVRTSDVTKTYDGTLGGVGAAVVTAGTLYQNASNGNVLDNLSGGTFAFTNANAGSGNRTVTTSAVTVNDGNAGGNYNVTYGNNTTSTINRANITLGTSDVTKTYNGTLGAVGTAAVTAGALYQNASNGGAQDNLSGGTFAFTNANAGSGNKTVTTSGVTLNDGNAGANYNIAYANNTTSTISPASLSISTSNVTKTYDGTLTANGSAVAVTGTLYNNASNGNAQDALTGGSFAFIDKNAGSGNKAVTASGVTVGDGNSGNNYTVTYADNITSTINPASLNFVGTIANKEYDGTTAATVSGYTLTGFIGSETVDASTSSAAFGNKDAGPKSVGINGIALINGTNGGLASNYSVTPTSTATGTITPKLLTLSADVNDRLYDGTTNATLQSFDLGGFVGSETVTGNYTGSANFADRHVGSGKGITITGINLVNGANGGLAGNYSVPTTAASTASITAASLHVVGVVALDKVYDGTTIAYLNTQGATVTGRYGADDVQISSVTGTFLDKDVDANKTIGAGTVLLSGAAAGDYILVQPTGLTASVTPRTLVVSATAVEKVYDGTTEARANLTDNRVAGDGLAISSNAAYLDKNVGTGKFVDVTDITLSGTDAGNYTTETSTDAFGSITKANLTVNFAGTNKVYDGTTSAAVTLSGAPLAGDDVDVLYSSANFADKNAADGKTVNVGGITTTGVDSGNYATSSTGSTTANISPASLTVGAVGDSKTFDGTTQASVTFNDNRFTGDSLSLDASEQSFSDPLVGTDKLITVSGINIAGGPDAQNYVLANTQTTAQGEITGDTSSVAGTWTLPPVIPTPLPPMTAAAPRAVLALDLPSNFGGVGGSGSTQDNSSTARVGDGRSTNDSDRPEKSAGQANSGAESIARVLVTVTRMPLGQYPGLVSAVVSTKMLAAGEFKILLPAAMIDASDQSKVRVTLGNGGPLPKWLHYSAATKSIIAREVPPGALPLELVIYVDEQRWILKINAQT